MVERLPFKKGDEVWVKAKVQDCYQGTAGDSRWVDVEIEGRTTLFSVDASVVRPAELDVDSLFGGMPDGTVEVTRERWLELPVEGRAIIRTTVMHNGAGGESTRYFEVTSRG